MKNIKFKVDKVDGAVFIIPAFLVAWNYNIIEIVFTMFNVGIGLIIKRQNDETN